MKLTVSEEYGAILIVHVHSIVVLEISELSRPDFRGNEEVLTEVTIVGGNVVQAPGRKDTEI